MPTAPNLQNMMKFWHFLNVLKNSWKLQKLLESPPETCMWNLRQFGEVTIFEGKMPTALDLQNRMKLWHFLNVLQNSWNLQNLLESPPETCMWNLRQFGDVTIFEGKMLTAPDLQNRMKFWHSLNVLQNSWNLQNLLESPPETCMWNLRQFGEVTIFDGKMPTAPTVKTGWNFDIFSMFSKIHEVYRIYWNQHLTHACEIWGSSEKLQFLTEKCLQRLPSKQDEILTFLNVLKNSWNLQNLLESPPETCMWNLRQFGGVTIFDGKMPTVLDLQNRMKFWHFLNVLKNSWNLQNLLESPPETCMWNFRQFGEVTIFDVKMPTAPNLQNRMKFWHFLNVLKNSWNLQNLLESPPETCMWNFRQFREVTIFEGKMPTAPTFKTGLNLDIFSMFSKIHETYRSYWNHHQKHACEIWGSSEKLQFLTEKCLQRRTLKTGWNFDIFSMFSKIHEIYRIYWNHHQKHACEIWGSSEKLQFLTEKCLQRRTFKTGWNFDIFSMFSKIHETYRIYWNHHQKHACEIWGSLEMLQFFREKCRQHRTFKTGWSFEFSQCSPKFMKLTEFIGITTRNMHVKFEAVWRCYNFLGKNADSTGPSKQNENLTFSQCSPKFMKLTEVIGITTRNMHVKFEAVWRSYNFWQKMPTAPVLRDRMKFWLFLNVLQNSWNLQELLESPPETCMWNLRQFGEVTIFDGKMPTAPDLQNRMKFWHFLNVLKYSWNLQNLLESPPETCMWNLRQFGEVTIFDGKMPTAPDLQNRMKFWHFLNVLKNSWKLQNLLESPPETCMWNLRQFGGVTIFDGKMPTALDLQNRMKFWHFLNVLQNSSPETCMWNLRQFGDVTIFEGKMPTALDLQNRMKFWHSLNVLQNS